jgi:chitinase
MKHVIHGLAIIASVLGFFSFAHAADEPWIMLYYPSWHRETVPVRDMPWESITHVAAGPVIPKADGSLNVHFGTTERIGKRWMRSVASRAERENVIPILFVGGATGRDEWKSASSAKNRKKFAAALVATADELGYKGIDLDWEPLFESDLPDLMALATEIKKRDSSLILTLPVAYVNRGLTASPEFGTVEKLFDQVNIMTYDMAGTWSGWNTWHHSALSGAEPTTPSSIETSVAAYRAAGVPQEKLGIGIPQYGYCWTGPQKPGDPVPTDNRPRTLTYNAILKDYYTSRARQYDQRAESPYLTFKRPKGIGDCTFISYVDPRAARARAQYVRDQGLGGVIIWAAGQAHSARTRDEHPIVSAIAQTIRLD